MRTRTKMIVTVLAIIVCSMVVLANDFRSTYSTLVDRWLGLDPVSITNGMYEQFDFIGRTAKQS